MSLRQRRDTTKNSAATGIAQTADRSDETTKGVLHWDPAVIRANVWTKRLQPLLLAVWLLRIVGVVSGVMLGRPLMRAVGVMRRAVGPDSTLGRYLPRTHARDLTADYLTRMFRARGLLSPADSVASLSFEDVEPEEEEEEAASQPPASSDPAASSKANAGQMSSMTRVQLTYAGPTASNAAYPSSVVIKGTPQFGALHGFMIIFDIFKVESIMFDDPALSGSLRAALPPCVRLPLCYGSYRSSISGDGWVMMEDMKCGVDGQKFTHFPSSLIQTGVPIPARAQETVIDGLAALHAATQSLLDKHFEALHALGPGGLVLSPLKNFPRSLYADDSGSDLADRLRRESNSAFLYVMIGSGWRSMLRTVPHHLQTVLGQVYDFFEADGVVVHISAMMRHFQTLRPEFFAIGHGDLHSGNMFFSEKLDQLVLVDWQASLVRAVTLDLSYFMLTSVTVEERAEVEPRLIARYWAAHEARRLAAGHAPRTTAEAAAAHADFMLLYKASILYNLMILFGMAWGIVERNLASLNDDNHKAGRPVVPFVEFGAAQFLLNIAQRSHDMILDHNILPLIKEWSIKKK